MKTPPFERGHPHHWGQERASPVVLEYLEVPDHVDGDAGRLDARVSGRVVGCPDVSVAGYGRHQSSIRPLVYMAVSGHSAFVHYLMSVVNLTLIL